MKKIPPKAKKKKSMLADERRLSQWASKQRDIFKNKETKEYLSEMDPDTAKVIMQYFKNIGHGEESWLFKDGEKKKEKPAEEVAWSAATISNAVMELLDEKDVAKEDRRFRRSRLHSQYISDAFKATEDPKYQYNAYTASPLSTKSDEGVESYNSYNIGDILYAGRKSTTGDTTNWSYDDFMKASQAGTSYGSHGNIITDKGQDEQGSYYMMSGGNRNNPSGPGETFRSTKTYYNPETGELSDRGKNYYKAALTLNKELRANNELLESRDVLPETPVPSLGSQMTKVQMDKLATDARKNIAMNYQKPPRRSKSSRKAKMQTGGAPPTKQSDAAGDGEYWKKILRTTLNPKRRAEAKKQLKLIEGMTDKEKQSWQEYDAEGNLMNFKFGSKEGEEYGKKLGEDYLKSLGEDVEVGTSPAPEPPSKTSDIAGVAGGVGSQLFSSALTKDKLKRDEKYNEAMKDSYVAKNLSPEELYKQRMGKVTTSASAFDPGDKEKQQFLKAGEKAGERVSQASVTGNPIVMALAGVEGAIEGGITAGTDYEKKVKDFWKTNRENVSKTEREGAQIVAGVDTTSEKNLNYNLTAKKGGRIMKKGGTTLKEEKISSYAIPSPPKTTSKPNVHLNIPGKSINVSNIGKNTKYGISANPGGVNVSVKIPLNKKKKSGGQIIGPGTGTSDSISTSLTKGSFVVPANNAKKAAALRLNLLGETPKKAKLKKGGVPVKVSNGEHLFTPKEINTMVKKGGGKVIDYLNSLAPEAEVPLNKGGRAIPLKAGGTGDPMNDYANMIANEIRKRYPEVKDSTLQSIITVAMHETNNFTKLEEPEAYAKTKDYKGGSKYRGRGVFHITHDHAYKKAQEYLSKKYKETGNEKYNIDIIENPEKLNADSKIGIEVSMELLDQGYFGKGKTLKEIVTEDSSPEQIYKGSINPAGYKESTRKSFETRGAKVKKIPLTGAVTGKPTTPIKDVIEGIENATIEELETALKGAEGGGAGAEGLDAKDAVNQLNYYIAKAKGEDVSNYAFQPSKKKDHKVLTGDKTYQMAKFTDTGWKQFNIKATTDKNGNTKYQTVDSEGKPIYNVEGVTRKDVINSGKELHENKGLAFSEDATGPAGDETYQGTGDVFRTDDGKMAYYGKPEFRSMKPEAQKKFLEEKKIETGKQYEQRARKSEEDDLRSIKKYTNEFQSELDNVSQELLKLEESREHLAKYAKPKLTSEETKVINNRLTNVNKELKEIEATGEIVPGTKGNLLEQKSFLESQINPQKWWKYATQTEMRRALNVYQFGKDAYKAVGIKDKFLDLPFIKLNSEKYENILNAGQLNTKNIPFPKGSKGETLRNKEQELKTKVRRLEGQYKKTEHQNIVGKLQSTIDDKKAKLLELKKQGKKEYDPIIKNLKKEVDYAAIKLSNEQERIGLTGGYPIKGPYGTKAKQEPETLKKKPSKVMSKRDQEFYDRNQELQDYIAKKPPPQKKSQPSKYKKAAIEEDREEIPLIEVPSELTKEDVDEIRKEQSEKDIAEMEAQKPDVEEDVEKLQEKTSQEGIPAKPDLGFDLTDALSLFQAKKGLEGIGEQRPAPPEESPYLTNMLMEIDRLETETPDPAAQQFRDADEILKTALLTRSGDRASERGSRLLGISETNKAKQRIREARYNRMRGDKQLEMQKTAMKAPIAAKLAAKQESDYKYTLDAFNQDKMAYANLLNAGLANFIGNQQKKRFNRSLSQIKGNTINLTTPS